MTSEGINIDKVAKLYKNWTETCVISCLTGCMGKVYVDNPSDPKSAVCVLGDFAFYAGEPSMELVSLIPEGKAVGSFIIKVSDSDKWDEMFVSYHKDKCKLHERHMIKKDTVFDVEHLEKLKGSLIEGYSIKKFDRDLYDYCIQNSWAKDFVAQFRDADDYLLHGRGMGVMYEGELVAGASSYSYYPSGIEIEVVTREDHRLKGLATACCAALILDCLKDGLYPSWDAANMNSVKLSKKLGYEYNYKYNSYDIII